MHPRQAQWPSIVTSENSLGDVDSEWLLNAETQAKDGSLERDGLVQKRSA
jgi:hypothetical protein